MPREPHDDEPPQMPQRISDRERTAYIRAHLRCPRCRIATGWIGELTLVRQDADGELIATNQAKCVAAKCGWSGLMDALLP